MTEQDKHHKQLQVIKRMYRRQMFIFGAIILAAGVVIGAAGTILHYEAIKPQKPSGIEFVNKRMIAHLTEELQLTEDQQKRIKDVFADHMKNLYEIRMQARPLIAEEMNSLNENVLEILDDSQDAKWTENINRLRDRFDPKDRQRRGPDENNNQWKKHRQRDGSPDQKPFDFWEDQKEKPQGTDDGQRQKRRRRQDQQSPEDFDDMPPLPPDFPGPMSEDGLPPLDDKPTEQPQDTPQE